MPHNILAIGAHYDDVELGCGASLAKHKSLGDAVHIFVASVSGFDDPFGNPVRDSDQAAIEGRISSEILGAKTLHQGNFPTNSIPLNDRLTAMIRAVIEEHEIDWVYTHWPHDAHLDHQTVARASLSAARHVPRLLFYRSNHFFGTEQPSYNFFNDVSDHLELKIAALKAYKSEYDRAGKMWQDTVLDEASYWGKRLGVKYAEGFVSSRFLHE